MKRGKFIVLEGIDGSGTTTACKSITENLNARGKPTIHTFEPSSGVLGSLARSLLKTDVKVDPKVLALLFASDRLQHVDDVIMPALLEGKTVICDRYVMSSYAYQSFHCDYEWIVKLNSHAFRPDMTIWLDVDVEVAAQRVAARSQKTGEAPERFEVPEIQRHVDRVYRSIYQSRDRFSMQGDIVRVDSGSFPADEVARRCLDAIETIVEVPTRPLNEK